MIYIEHCTDFEFYSGNSKGAIQGYGYVFASGKLTILVTPSCSPYWDKNGSGPALICI
jgi:hypothetical protein